MSDCQVYPIPADFEDSDGVHNALFYLERPKEEQLAVLVGFIPDPFRYKCLYEALLNKNIRLINSLEDHLRIMEFDRFYPLIEDLTPKSVIISSPDQCQEAIEKIGFPMFVKGAVKSRKEWGFNACVAHNEDELARMCKDFLRRDYTARNKMIARELVNLWHVHKTPLGFPMGREYRVFLYKDTVLGYGYYWGTTDPLSNLAAQEEQEVLKLAVEASTRIGTPLAVIDIGQTTEAKWIVIETGDPQCSGITQMSALGFWNKMKEAM